MNDKLDKLLESMATVKTDVKWIKERSKIAAGIIAAITGAIISGVINLIVYLATKHN